jgi:hypothetical protein
MAGEKVKNHTPKNYKAGLQMLFVGKKKNLTK